MMYGLLLEKEKKKLGCFMDTWLKKKKSEEKSKTVYGFEALLDFKC